MEPSEVKRIYNDKIKSKEGGDYEYSRWFSSSVKKAGYEMTKGVILRHCLKDNLKFSSYLELGPGAGTWTNFFYEHSPGAYFVLVDISGEMLGLAKKKMGDKDNIKYWEGDFLNFNAQAKFDFFFSCRAFEYLPDKVKAIEKIRQALKSKGVGFIITKSPKYIRNKLLGRSFSKLHQGQISARELRKILLKNGFIDIKIYPATMVFPLLSIAALDKLFYFIFSRFQLNFISNLFCESYCVKFKKL